MRPYDEFEREIRQRQDLALGWASRKRMALGTTVRTPRPARVRLAAGLRLLAGWIEGGDAAPSVTLRPS